MNTQQNTFDLQAMVPLFDEATIAQIAQDLDALQKTPINSWDNVYPTLFKSLNSVVEQLCAAMNCPRPGLVIRFDAPQVAIMMSLQSYQASAMLMTNGSTQLHIGANFIRRFLLTPTQHNIVAMHRAFLWSIAHELGHLTDPMFKAYGNTHRARAIFDRVTLILSISGAISFFLPAHIVLINPFVFLATAGLMLTKTVAVMALHWQFEYAADKQTLFNREQGFCPDDAQLALEVMTAEITQCIERRTARIPGSGVIDQLLATITRRHFLSKSFAVHPSISSRIERMNQLWKK
jgi:hypothetical protein